MRFRLVLQQDSAEQGERLPACFGSTGGRGFAGFRLDPVFSVKCCIPPTACFYGVSSGDPRCSDASSQDAPEPGPNEPSKLCGQAADIHESASSDGGVSPELIMEDGEDGSTLPDEWEGKIIGEKGSGGETRKAENKGRGVRYL